MTDQETREAREWAEYITSLPNLHGGYLQHARAAARFILDNTTPALPDPLFGARATHPDHGEGIVISHFPDGYGDVWFMFPDESTSDGTNYQWVPPSTLTFHTPDHPEFLETEEDYRNAPYGTIVAENGRWPYIATMTGWADPPGTYASHAEMTGIRRRVLRWGWEA